MTRENFSGMERRRHPRTQLQMMLRGVRLDPDGGNPVDVLQTIDISRGGLGAYTDRPAYPGQRVLVCLPLSGRAGRRNVYATVVRCRQCQEEGCRIGLEFDTASVGAWIGCSTTAVAA